MFQVRQISIRQVYISTKFDNAIYQCYPSTPWPYCGILFVRTEYLHPDDHLSNPRLKNTFRRQGSNYFLAENCYLMDSSHYRLDFNGRSLFLLLYGPYFLLLIQRQHRLKSFDSLTAFLPIIALMYHGEKWRKSLGNPTSY